eukprot:8113426-Ditylum_brightwellii.AAC.1
MKQIFGGLHVPDVSNPTGPGAISQKWAYTIEEEFFHPLQINRAFWNNIQNCDITPKKKTSYHILIPTKKMIYCPEISKDDVNTSSERSGCSCPFFLRQQTMEYTSHIL